MITKEQLQVMSDFEVNKALAKLVCKTHATHSNGGGGIVCADNERVDYCNIPNDIMPLAFEYAIGIETNPVKTEWLARTCDISMSRMSFRCYVEKNPLRAIACCLILVLQEQKQ